MISSSRILKVSGKPVKSSSEYSGVFLTCTSRNGNGMSPLSGEYNTQCHPDKFADREIGQIVVECEFKNCPWRHRIKDLDVSILLDWFS